MTQGSHVHHRLYFLLTDTCVFLHIPGNNPLLYIGVWGSGTAYKKNRPADTSGLVRFAFFFFPFFPLFSFYDVYFFSPGC